MATSVSMTKMGPEMEAGLLVEWLVADGDIVVEGQPVATIETDKLTTDLEAPAGGPITLLVAVGGEYQVGTALATIEAADSAAAPSARHDPPVATPASSRSRAVSSVARDRSTPADDGAAAVVAMRIALTEARRGEPSASPVARRMAQALGISLSDVKPSPHRRTIRKRDVEAAHLARSQRELAEGSRDRPGGTLAGLSPMRRRIAQRMRDSLLATAQITDFREHEVSDLIEFRQAGLSWANAIGFRVSFTDLFVRATVIALQRVPSLNATLDSDGRLIAHDEVNLGLAVALPDGLIVPVLRDAGALNLAELHNQILDLVTRAREGRLGVTEVRGGTFTLTNIGTYGSHTATPILVEGQVGIIGTGALLQRPVVRDGRVVPGTVMHTSLTIDHRIIDGQAAGDFQTAWGDAITHPGGLL
jgi:pyruvate/2-oxoglutarate dehydrogenase complex dihydrolipoamide acyltransferase (E2) component